MNPAPPPIITPLSVKESLEYRLDHEINSLKKVVRSSHIVSLLFILISIFLYFYMDYSNFFLSPSFPLFGGVVGEHLFVKFVIVRKILKKIDMLKTELILES
jgi:hypothetical protein